MVGLAISVCTGCSRISKSLQVRGALKTDNTSGPKSSLVVSVFIEV